MPDPYPLVYLPRAAWDTRGGARLGRRIDPARRKMVVIHHTAAVDDDDTPNLWESLEEVLSYMRRLKVARPDLGEGGVSDVPYQLVLFLGRACTWLVEGRGVHRHGAHVAKLNTPAVGIAVAGRFDGDISSDAAKRIPLALRALGDWLDHQVEHAGFAALWDRRPPLDQITGRRVWAHGDIKATACPGRHLLEALHLI